MPESEWKFNDIILHFAYIYTYIRRDVTVVLFRRLIIIKLFQNKTRRVYIIIIRRRASFRTYGKSLASYNSQTSSRRYSPRDCTHASTRGGIFKKFRAWTNRANKIILQLNFSFTHTQPGALNFPLSFIRMHIYVLFIQRELEFFIEKCSTRALPES